MLHALGITHVVSVGECALVPPHATVSPTATPHQPGAPYVFGQNEQANCGTQLVVNAGPNGQGSLWIEEREGRIKVLDIKVRIFLP